MISVAVLGMGVIGKRAVHAIRAQPDLRLSAVILRSPGPSALATPHLPFHGFDPAATRALRGAGLPCSGELADALAACDVVVDCGQARTGAGRHAIYRAAGVRSVYCGGERSAALGPLVHPELNPAALAGSPSVRLASCNTTAVARLFAAIGPASIDRADLLVLRCCTDSDKAGKGVTNGIRLEVTPTHHGDDLAAMWPATPVRSVAATVPMTAGHVIHVRLHLATDAPGNLRTGPRLALRESAEPLDTARLKDSLWHRRWHDRYEVLVQALPTRHAREREYWLALDNEAVTIPELVDVVRGSCTADPLAAAATTDAALRIGRAPRSTTGGEQSVDQPGELQGQDHRPAGPPDPRRGVPGHHAPAG